MFGQNICLSEWSSDWETGRSGLALSAKWAHVSSTRPCEGWETPTENTHSHGLLSHWICKYSHKRICKTAQGQINTSGVFSGLLVAQKQLWGWGNLPVLYLQSEESLPFAEFVHNYFICNMISYAQKFPLLKFAVTCFETVTHIYLQ